MKEIETTRKYYDKYGDLWINTKTNSFAHEKPFHKLVSLWPQKARIIDIGCAGGIHVPLFLGIGRKLKYQGIDISKLFIKTATRRYPQLNFLLGNVADSTTLPKTKFDGFYASAILMHIPFERWDTMFSNIENINKPGSFGYITLPITHPSAVKNENDVRHFTILTEAEQVAYLKKRNWKIKSKGTLDGTSTANVWKYYIVQLP
ncbi:MAG: class I SAM-dependent methyltransferase [Patescibacteria group bacterium]